MARIMEAGIWQELYRNIKSPRLENTVVGFNTNLDRVIPVTRELLNSPVFLHKDLFELRARLIYSMQQGTAEEWFVSDAAQYRRFTDAFSRTGAIAIGGQAGIAALHLSGLGVGRVVCAAPSHGPESAGILTNAGIIVPEFATGKIPADDTTHLVFEYAPGLVILAPGVIPRNNRFIVSPVHIPSSVIIPESRMGGFLYEIASCNRAFLSGYQYLRSDREFAVARDQMDLMKKHNSSLRIHIECVSVTDEEVIRRFTRFILPGADSLGLNEHEFSILLDHLNLSGMGHRETDVLAPEQNMEYALALCQTLGLKRLHVHTFGYYILVIRSDVANAERSRNALLYASREAAHAAQGTGIAISADGIRAAGMADTVFGPADSAGIFPEGPYVLLIIPTEIASNSKKTSGLGDILSSTAFVADEF